LVKSVTAGRSPRRGFSCAAVAAWYDHERDGRAVCILLALFVAVWTCFQIVVFSAIGLNDDLTEVFVWSRHPSAGYSKHPPLSGLMASAWFAVFPVADWSFHLFAMVNCAIALLAVYLIARRYVEGDKRLLVLLLLLLTPFYQFHGQRFSTNQTLLSTWPIATYCFLRAFESRRLGWSAIAGATAALALLGKYYSIYLVAGFVVAALWHPRRLDYLRSPAPWVSIVSGLAVLAPHLHWLATTGPGPFRYAMAVHGAASAWDELRTTLAYAVGGAAYVLLPMIVYGLAVRPDRRLLAQAVWPDDPDRRMLVLLLATPLLLPMLTAPLIGVELTSLWTMSAWFLLPIVLLAPTQITLTRASAVRVAVGVAVMTAACLVAAPAIAWNNYMRESKNGRAYYQVVSEELTRAWRATMRRPLSIVTGDYPLALATSFYSQDHPDSTPYFGSPAAPWVTDERRAREGWASVCFANDKPCLDQTARNSAGRSGVVRVGEELSVSFFGMSSASAQFVFVMVPPQQ
jgi:4-amino-4-deoxy-L-arabinose transferase-like glycosyltransferase